MNHPDDRHHHDPQAYESLWGELRSLSDRDAGEVAYVQRLLELWCGHVGASGAALYLEREARDSEAETPGASHRELLREISVGEGTFPATLAAEGPSSENPDAAPGDLTVHSLPGGLLAASHGADDAAGNGGASPEGTRSEVLTLLLATSLRALRLRKQLKQQHFQVNYRVVELESVYDVGLAIAGTLDLDQLSEEILLRAVSLLDARVAAFYLREADAYRLDRTFGGEARQRVPLDDPALESFLVGKGAPPEDLVPGAQHLMGVGIGGHRQPQGLIVVADKESRKGVGPFGVSDRRTLSLFANQAAIALENARLHRQALEKERLEREMELAAEIQRQILPDGAPALPGWELLGWNRPARQVGGDYYDLRSREGGLTFTVADVTGKGIAAALLVSTLHSALNLLLDRVGVAPELFSRLNGHILDSSARNKFITLLLADLDAASGDVSYVNAGHNPGLLLRAWEGKAARDGDVAPGDDCEVVPLSPGGLPLGLMPGGEYKVGRVHMGPGDLMCLFTDGITECANREDEEYGEARLIDCLRRTRDKTLGDIVACIDGETQAFAAGLPQLDDQTIILLRRNAA